MDIFIENSGMPEPILRQFFEEHPDDDHYEVRELIDKVKWLYLLNCFEHLCEKDNGEDCEECKIPPYAYTCPYCEETTVISNGAVDEKLKNVCLTDTCILDSLKCVGIRADIDKMVLSVISDDDQE